MLSNLISTLSGIWSKVVSLNWMAIGAAAGAASFLYLLCQWIYAMRSFIFRILHSWPIRIKVLGEVSGMFLYPQGHCHVEVIAEFHTRKSPVTLKTIHLEIKGLTNDEIAHSFLVNDKYQQLWFTTKRKEEFIYDDFENGRQGRLVARADDGECRTPWFPIQLKNEKLIPMNLIKSRQLILDEENEL
jgi:hypothetical protein